MLFDETVEALQELDFGLGLVAETGQQSGSTFVVITKQRRVSGGAERQLGDQPMCSLGTATPATVKSYSRVHKGWHAKLTIITGTDRRVVAAHPHAGTPGCSGFRLSFCPLRGRDPGETKPPDVAGEMVIMRVVEPLHRVTELEFRLVDRLLIAKNLILWLTLLHPLETERSE